MSRRILIVDDDTSSRENISQFLRDAGYEVREVENGYEAAQLIKEEAFDLVLSELVMPEGNGLYLLQRARSVAPNTPVLIMSARPDITPAEITELGASGFIGKSFVPEELLLNVQQALRLKHA
jgi:DNA-binding NtrC family response regulator